jgi:glutathione S-transferase
MMLIGRYASPYTRRVAVALQVYDMAYRHESWSSFTEFERIAAHNPSARVPVLVLDSGEALIESAAILDYLDELAGPERAMIAPQGAERRAALRVCALAMSICDKLLSMIYDARNHAIACEAWRLRCEDQVARILDVLERQCADRGTGYWFGGRLTHADTAVTCAITFMRAVAPALLAREAWPALAGHVALCEALPAFAATAPTFPPPAT